MALALVLYWRMFSPSHPPSGGENQGMAQIEQTIAAVSHGGPITILKENAKEWKECLLGLLSPYGLYPLTLFLLGLYVWRTGVITHLIDYKAVLKRVCMICLPLGIFLNTAVITGFMFLTPGANGGLPMLLRLLLTSIWFVFLTLTAGYASAVALLVLNDKWRHRLAPVAAAGRMALTNYVMQSVLCTAFFYGTGLYGRVGPAMGLIPTVLVYALQVVFSAWWLKRFRFGPLEWIWRALTYKQFPEFRRPTLPPRLAAAA
jgi:uncharacterized protein